ncbi:SBBP repeat-containing protein [Hymenobacter tibetensis]|uniref:SBBP repeat-containing protein n=1 Tax=Hymenobacter tibetensis TaxID=497967 RepID=A0ABY4CSF2_9BACT|nr:SBBP repeat-containing protein [Hymenobacter tibetensis]UOG73188.1 SBBP repeat-containing protein [Hymenobacter tibetensis]
MKQAFTSLLLAAGFLVQSLGAHAQASSSAPVGKAPRPFPVLPQERTLPGAPALRHALPTLGKAAPASARPGRPAQRLLAPPTAKQAAATLQDRTQAALAGPVSEAWTARFKGPTYSYDVATSTTSDAAGNVYVTGYAISVLSIDYDYVTTKYDPSGLEVWAVHYSGSGTSDDIPTSIAADTLGNVYVTGYSLGRSTNYGYATVKYSSSGQQLWAARYDGAANGDDMATGVAVDAAGNVVVTGTSYGSTATYDYLTVKYSGSGQQLWTARYSGTGTGSDEVPTDVALDGAGNVLVTGTLYSNGQSDYATLKYSSTGQQLWATRYNGPANGYDLVRDLAVDAAGNVAVTGTSDAGSGTGYDYATVKYTGATGQPLWTARHTGAGTSYDEAAALTTDAAGNVIVTGYADAGTGYDYTTLKYAAATGQPLWTTRYNGPANSYDEAKDVVVDASNNVVVTGGSYNSSGNTDYATVKYSGADGLQLWVARYNGPTNGDEEAVSLGLDKAGNVAVTGTSFTSSNDFDYATLKYAAATGEPLWEGRYSNSLANSNDDAAKDIAVDAAGNVYITGSSAGSGTRYDYSTIKYSPNGQQLWEARYDAPGDSFDTAISLAVDAAGNVYVTGTSNSDYATIKYSPSGQQLWVARYNGPANSMDDPKEVVVDAAGNVYVTGYSIDSSTSYDYLTIKYSNTGEQLWVARYNGAGASIEQASSLAVDAAGNVYVTGASFGRFDYVTVKYSPSGQLLWIAPYSGIGNGNGAGTDVAVDAAGNVYVTGYSNGGSSSHDYATVKYSASGQQLWASRYNGPGNREDQAAKLAVDPSTGNVYVTGRSYGSNSFTSSDYATLKYAAADGTQLWLARYNGPANGPDVATDLALDAATGSVYVTGYSDNTLGNFSNDYATLAYSATGQLLWNARYDGPDNGSDQASAIALDATGNVYVTGYSSVSASYSDFLTIKYTQTSTTALQPLATQDVWAAASQHVQDLSVYPNPTVGQASVSFRPVQDGAAQVLIYNQLGRQVASLYNGVVHKGQRYTLALDGQQLAPGLYTCSLLVDGQRETVRMVVAH